MGLSLLLSSDSSETSLCDFSLGFFHIEVFEGVQEPLANHYELTHFVCLVILLFEFFSVLLDGDVILNETVVKACVSLLAFGLLDFLYFNGEDCLVLEFDLC